MGIQASSRKVSGSFVRSVASSREINNNLKYRALDKNHSVLKPEFKWVYFTIEQLIDGEPVNGFGDIDKSTICRFTGLKDKNGEEIWEGDIVAQYVQPGKRKRYVSTKLVEWVETGTYSGWSVARGFKGGRREVIGNIYENPELLDKAEGFLKQTKAASEPRTSQKASPK
jgi:hypothetical protein